MESYQNLSKEQLLALKSELEASYEEKKALNLQLDMSRGSRAQASLMYPLA